MTMTKEYKKFTRDEIRELKQWGTSHITAIFKHLGIQFIDRGRFLTACCPVPYHPGDGDNPRAFTWTCEQGIWRCYSHGCHEDTSTDVVGLIMAMKEMAFPQALRYIDKLKNGELEDAPEDNKYLRKQGLKQNLSVDPEKLKILQPDRYFRGRGISEEILRKHKVGYWQKTGTFMDRRAIVPIFDVNDNIMGFTGRLLLTDEEIAQTDHAKWVHGKDFVARKAGTFNKGAVLYNLNHCKDIVHKTRKVYIVEGPIDVWKLQMAGVYNVVATLGLGMSFEQQELLVSLGVETVYLCYDNDVKDDGENAGLGGAERVKRQIENTFNVEIKLPPEGRDYGELTVGEILENLL